MGVGCEVVALKRVRLTDNRFDIWNCHLEMPNKVNARYLSKKQDVFFSIGIFKNVRRKDLK